MELDSDAGQAMQQAVDRQKAVDELAKRRAEGGDLLAPPAICLGDVCAPWWPEVRSVLTVGFIHDLP